MRGRRASAAFFSAQDVTSAAKVAVLGKTVNEMLFGVDADPIGQVIRVRNQPFKVIGVMAAKGQSGMGADMDDQILAPYTTVHEEAARHHESPRHHRVGRIGRRNHRRSPTQIAVLLRTRHKIVPGPGR